MKEQVVKARKKERELMDRISQGIYEAVKSNKQNEEKVL